MPQKNPFALAEKNLIWQSVEQQPVKGGPDIVTLHTNDGDIDCRYHSVPDNKAIGGVVWVGGSGGGHDGPARGLYPECCRRLQTRNVAGVRLHYRYPNHLEDCVLDTLLGVEFLKREGVHRVALVGHSFGGAVVIGAGAQSEDVAAVIPMSTQTYGVDRAPNLSPRPILVIHGTKDEILADRCSRYLYQIAREPKELKLFEGARHGLDECRDELIELLVEWIPKQLASVSAGRR